jgi:hypothetical protein
MSYDEFIKLSSDNRSKYLFRLQSLEFNFLFCYFICLIAMVSAYFESDSFIVYSSAILSIIVVFFFAYSKSKLDEEFLGDV